MRAGVTVTPRLVVLGGFAGREMADVWQFCPASKKWTVLDVSLEPACSVALCLGLGSSVLLFGGELEPSDRWAKLVQNSTVLPGATREPGTSAPTHACLMQI